MLFTILNLPDINMMVLFGGLERTPTFLVPIINPPFADNSPLLYKHALLNINLSLCYHIDTRIA